MWGVEQDRSAPLRRLDDLKWRIELVLRLVHGTGFLECWLLLGRQARRILLVFAGIVQAGIGRIEPPFTACLPAIRLMDGREHPRGARQRLTKRLRDATKGVKLLWLW
jgi:hypothetical protein